MEQLGMDFESVLRYITYNCVKNKCFKNKDMYCLNLKDLDYINAVLGEYLVEGGYYYVDRITKSVEKGAKIYSGVIKLFSGDKSSSWIFYYKEGVKEPEYFLNIL